MKKPAVVFILFLTAALYDGLLGLGFLFSADSLFQKFQVTPPNHYGYVHFSAALLIVFALMYLAIAGNPQGNRNLIPYGMLLKVSYCSVTGYYWFMDNLPSIWKPFIFYDLVFLGLFAWAYVALRERGQMEEQQNE